MNARTTFFGAKGEVLDISIPPALMASGVDSRPKLVTLALALLSRRGEYGGRREIFCDEGEIAKACGLSLRNVRAGLKWLEQEGWIERRRGPSRLGPFVLLWLPGPGGAP